MATFQKLPLRKLVVELRYKPDLAFYGKMDAMGIELAEDFPDWERTSLTLEVRNKKNHRRLYLSVKRAFYDADDADPNAEFSSTEKLLKRVCQTLGVQAFKRLGLRQWFAADLDKSFAVMVDEFSQRFLPRSEELSGILADATKDVAYVADYETSEGWRYNLRLGPMMKSQWFLTVAHELNAFEQPEEGSETFENYKRSFPEQFLFIDIDCYWEDQAAEKLDKFLTSVRRRSHDLAAKLIDYCRK